MEYKVKHLEMIQGVINRMSNNSFSLKGWAVTLVAGIFALSSNDTERTFFLVSYIPVIIFWFLDSYYLYMENLYCELYKKVALQEGNCNFSMDLNDYDVNKSINGYLKAILSKTELWFYLPLALGIGLVFFLL